MIGKPIEVKPGKTDYLRVRYRPQIAAYWKAIMETTGSQVAAGIYSTSAGQLIIYEPEELASEWKRLGDLPLQ